MEGEKEIVLGNRQLVGFFFTVLALCGVFFALGYIVRGNALKQPATEAAAPVSTAAQAAPSPVAAVAQESEPPRETAETPTPAASTAAAQSEQPTDTPASPQAAQTAAPVQGEPLETGVSYLQVAALRRPDAESLMKTLHEQNFTGVIEPSSRPDLFRVLIGPYRQISDLADAKLKLKALGFADAKIEKR